MRIAFDVGITTLSKIRLLSAFHRDGGRVNLGLVAKPDDVVTLRPARVVHAATPQSASRQKESSGISSIAAASARARLLRGLVASRMRRTMRTATPSASAV
ncbi:hypothetical protein MIC448_1640012 [Microbacterium sp. C448]|nr:hypothetical protein MIC448_1640012 [Microbacterium sp. C448]